jgi:cytochrome P450
MIESPSLVDEVSALFDLRPDLMQNPYPLYARMRQEAPFLKHRAVVSVSRYRDVEKILLDTSNFSNYQYAGSRVDDIVNRAPEEKRQILRDTMYFFGRWMTSMDPPEHTRLRGLVHKVFTPRRVADMRPTIESIVDRLVARARGKGTIEFMDDFAYGLPMYVIGEMLGAEERDLDRIRHWALVMATFQGTNMSNFEETHDAMAEFRAYVRELVAIRRRQPHTDLLAAMLAVEDKGDRLTDYELEGMFTVLFFAGHETTTNLMGNGLLALLRNPDQLTLLREEPGLIGNAVEEILRYDTSVQSLTRLPKRDTVVNGELIPEGTTVRVFLGAAGRDPDRYPEPEKFDIRREDLRHLSFNIGPHYCLGQALARLEAQIAIGTFVREFPQMQLAGEAPFRPNMVQRRPAQLPIALNA